MFQCELEKDPNDSSKNKCKICQREFISEWPAKNIKLVCHDQSKEKRIVLQELKSKKEPKPIVPLGESVKNLWNTMKAFAGDGFATTTKEEYDTRYAICTDCEFRDKNRCSVCTCNLVAKCKIRASDCPKNKWPKLN